jgi:hypothetical protein
MTDVPSDSESATESPVRSQRCFGLSPDVSLYDNDRMADEQDKTRRVPWAMIPIALLVLYVLSAGPANWVRFNSQLRFARSAYSPCYAPIEYARHQSTAFNGFMRWYIGKLWGLKSFDDMCYRNPGYDGPGPGLMK